MSRTSPDFTFSMTQVLFQKLQLSLNLWLNRLLTGYCTRVSPSLEDAPGTSITILVQAFQKMTLPVIAAVFSAMVSDQRIYLELDSLYPNCNTPSESAQRQLLDPFFSSITNTFSFQYPLALSIQNSCPDFQSPQVSLISLVKFQMTRVESACTISQLLFFSMYSIIHTWLRSLSLGIPTVGTLFVQFFDYS